MKKLPWILIVLLVIACIVVWFRPHEQPPAEVRVETKIKTVVKVDTMLISAPMAVFWRFVPDDTTWIGDTLLHRRQVVYSDSLYRNSFMFDSSTGTCVKTSWDEGSKLIMGVAP